MKYINGLSAILGKETYIFLYDDDSHAETLKTFGRFAANKELSFTWYDAAVLSKKLREEKKKLHRSNLKSKPRF